MRKRRPHGYWHKWTHIEKELRELINLLGHFPTQTELAERGLGGMLDAIGDFHDGLNHVRKRLDYEPAIVERGKWKDLSFTLNEARKAMTEMGTRALPSGNELAARGYSSLALAISKYHGRFPNFRRLLGEENYARKLREVNFAIKEARMIIRKHGFDSLPCSGRLKDLGYSTFAGAIDRIYGFRRFRRFLGEKQRCQPRGKWQSRGFALEQLRRVMLREKCQTIPSGYQLTKWGYNMLAFALNEYHGGFRKLRQEMGGAQLKVEEGSWKSLEYALARASELMDQESLDELPGHERLIIFEGGPSLSKAIQKYHGGYSVFREELRQFRGGSSNKGRLERLLNAYVDNTN